MPEQIVQHEGEAHRTGNPPNDPFGYNNLTKLIECIFALKLRLNRAAQHELETDVKSKESAIGIDSVCHQMNNFSRGINYYGGIEKYDST